MNITGEIFSKMIISATNNLGNNKDEIDRLNVFPVPDGDTGKNMYLTMTGAAAAAKNAYELNAIAISDKIASATLKSARGNSGVILSQLFRGLSKGLSESNDITPEGLANALKHASDTAYHAVMKPTEGTILTVARECAASAIAAVKTSKDVTEVMQAAVIGARESLRKTPDLLPKLKEAGVVDAGGMGWLCILEGMLAVLETGNIIESAQPDTQNTSANAALAISSEEITFGYCTEFIIEKLNNSNSIDEFKSIISGLGDSMLVIEDFEVVKVHIHTNSPGIALQEGLKLGSLINIKIDNMRHQHNENITPPPADKKPYSIIAVSAGEGFSEIFKELGASRIIEGGQTMNPSAGDIEQAICEENAKVVYLLPNNKNIILAANQAKDLVDCTVHVIPTTSVPQGIASAIAFNPMSTDKENAKEMRDAAENIKTGLVTYAVRDSESDGVVIKEGDIIGLSYKKIVSSGGSIPDSVKSLCSSICDENTAVITLYYGIDVSEDDANTLAQELENSYPECDISVQYGGQPVYYYIISAE